MSGRTPITKQAAYLMASLALLVTLAIVLYPDVAFEASLEGLRVWWEIVFPALLPFFVAAEVLMALGVVHSLGVLLEPLMRPLFDVPGVGAFALAMGLTGGYPIGARITASLRKQGLCNQIEGERLLTFTNTADPLFMAGAVAVGMFHLPGLALTICGAHYISAIILGILLRFYGGPQPSRNHGISAKGNILKRALAELYRARQADGRPFGQLFGDSVRDSISSMLLIGGFIMMFSVMIKVLLVSGALRIIEQPIIYALRPLGIQATLIPPVISGLFEITLGTELASKAAAPLLQRVMIANAIIAWSGFSVLGQVTAMTAGTDIRITPYIVARIVHAIIAALVTVALMSPTGQGLASLVAPAFVARLAAERVPLYIRLVSSVASLARTLGIMVGVSIAIWFFRRIRLIFIRVGPYSSSAHRRRA